MMADARKPKTEGNLTRAKLAMIAALAVVLAVVLYLQYFAAEETALPEVAERESSAGSSKVSRTTSGESNGLPQPASTGDKKNWFDTEKSSDPWKPLPLKVALQFDPFATPPLFPQTIAHGRGATGPLTKEELEATTRAELESSSADARNALEALQRRGVKAVIAWHDRYYALVDDELIEVGDEIEGFKIVRISADGVDVVKELPR